MHKMNYILLLILALLSCSNNEIFNSENQMNVDDIVIEEPNPNAIKILSLGDSYTIGQSVCDTCRFPEQLKSGIKSNLDINAVVDLQIIAQTGWTTGNLIGATNQALPTNDQDIVTLLIGVNNQYQNASFSLYEEEFPELVRRAVTYAKGDKSNVIIVSIPDYAFTPFGQNSGNAQTISSEIDAYNAFARNYCVNNDITFVNITPITRQGLENPDLVANDQLHPSELAYSRFVELILPVALEKLQ